MSRPRRKFYVVWVGYAPGIYESWGECRAQVANYPGARYKSYDSVEEATAAYRGDPAEQLEILRTIVTHSGTAWTKPAPGTKAPDYPTYGIAVDGACAGNPGKFEYRAVDIATGSVLFNVGADGTLIGTNNIAEFLALIHIGAELARRGDSATPIYTDSRTALSWLRRRHSNSKLQDTPRTARTRELLARADAWLATHTIPNPIRKWDTDRWGEIPADFGRK